MGEDRVEPSECGIGALLMLGPDLPRDEFGHPYQPLFSFEGERITGLVEDQDGDVMAYRNNARGDPPVEPLTWQRAPEAIEAAARRWWAEESGHMR